MTEKISYKIVPTPLYSKQIRKLDKFTQTRIIKYLDNLVENGKDPKNKGKGLSGNRAGQWRYRIGDYRVITEIVDSKMVVLALEVGHRKELY